MGRVCPSLLPPRLCCTISCVDGYVHTMYQLLEPTRTSLAPHCEVIMTSPRLHCLPCCMHRAGGGASRRLPPLKLISLSWVIRRKLAIYPSQFPLPPPSLPPSLPLLPLPLWSFPSLLPPSLYSPFRSPTGPLICTACHCGLVPLIVSRARPLLPQIFIFAGGGVWLARLVPLNGWLSERNQKQVTNHRTPCYCMYLLIIIVLYF